MKARKGLDALSDYVTVSKYAQFDKSAGRRETWGESVARVFDMHRANYRGYSEVLAGMPSMQDFVTRRIVLPSMRSLQFGGSSLLGRGQDQKLYNCCFSYCDRPRFFQEGLFNLLCGSGVGYSVQRHHVDKLPEISKPKTGTGAAAGETYVVQDSIEGWADAAGALMDSYFRHDGDRLFFDYSQVRPKGSPLSSGVGTAPGPAGLAKAIMKANGLLASLVSKGVKKLQPIHCHDIMCFFADAVLSGGVRRSAMIALFSPDDEEMRNAKTGEWWEENAQRGRANNSAVFLEHDNDRKEFDAVTEAVQQFGEPGFAFFASKEHGANPCFEIGFRPQDEHGNSGWQFCNLVTIGMNAVKEEEDFYSACEIAAAIGTIQAGYTTFTYLGEVSENITRKEALIGVSMTGIAESELAKRPAVLRMGAKIIKRVNEHYAKVIGINKAARLTCVKPEGTSSIVLKTSPGVHPWHSKCGLRRVQGSPNEPLLQYVIEKNPAMVSGYTENGDVVLSFPWELDDGATLKKDSSAQDLLQTVLHVKKNWVDAGRNDDQSIDPTVHNNVSNTVTVGEADSWGDVFDSIWENRKDFCGVSLLAASGDLAYWNSPFAEVLDFDCLEEKYGAETVSRGEKLFIAQKKLHEHQSQKPPQSEEEECAVYLWRLDQYRKILECWQEMDFSEVKEKNGDSVDLSQAWACSGGQCEII